MHPTRVAAVLTIIAISRLAAADDTPADEATESGQDEVIVVEERAPEPVEQRISGDQLREVAGALGDPVRAATSLPGMVPTAVNRPDVYIRGAPPGNTAVLVDGVRVPLLFHGGVATSVIPATLVGSVSTFASAAPASYGGMAGGVIELETSAPARERRATARLTLFEGGGLVETPIGDRGSLLAAARFGDPALILALVADDDEKLRYWDYQARTTWRIGDHDRVEVLAFGSHDHLSEVEPSEGMEPEMRVDQLVSDFHRLDVRYEHESAGSRVRASVTGGWTVQGAAGLTVRDRSVAARLDGELRIAPSVLARAGAHLELDDYALDGITGDDPAAMSPATALPLPGNTVAGVHVDMVWDATKYLKLVPGVRVDAYHSTRDVDGATGTVPAIAPRLAMRWRVRRELAVLASVGIAHQYPLLRVGSAPTTAISVPGFWEGTRELQRAHQASAGIQWLLPGGVVYTATAFASTTYGLTDLPRQCAVVGGMMSDEPPPCDVRSTGHAFGLEMLLHRPLTARLGGLLAYTYSHATMDVPTEDGTQTLRSPFDRTHVVSAAVTYQLSSHWRLGSRVTAYSGAPVVVPDEGGSSHQIREPWYQRVDLRAERTWRLAQHSTIALVIDVLNATLSRPFRLECRPSCRLEPGNLFFVPSIGVEGTF